MATPILRPTALAEAEGVTLASVSGDAALDATRAPYATATIEAAFVDPDDAELLDPRDGVRVTLTAGDEQAGTERTFDLGLRSRTIDHKGKSIRMELASDEAILIEHGIPVRDVGAFAHQSSLRAVCDYVLGKAIPGAALAPGTADADVTTYTDAVNLITDPGTAATSQPAATGYMVGNAQLGLNDTTWSISGDGDCYLIHTPTSADSYIGIGAQTSTSWGFQPGKTYVFSGTGNVKTAFTGTDYPADAADAGGGANLKRTRALTVHIARPGGTETWHSAQVPNTIDTPTRVWVKFTIPDDATAWSLRAYLGNTAGQIRWDGFRLSEYDDRPGVDNAEYFDGDTLDTAAYTYTWEGTPDTSQSKRTAIIDRAPELLIWEPGVTAWEFLAPITATAGLRLFCDEERVWRLIDPTAYDVPGVLAVTGANATEGTDSVARGDTAAWCTLVIVIYRWIDREGNRRETVDTAGVPGPTLVWEFDRPYPGPGAAAAILARRQGAGRIQDVTALADWNATPGMEARIILPATVAQIGQVTGVTWTLDNGLMRVAASGLRDTPPGAIDLLEGTIDELEGSIDDL